MAETFATDQFSLRWNNFSNNLTSGFMSHLSDKDLVDVTLAVDGQLLQAHKLVLSICSPYFKDIFKNNPCQHPVVILQDIGYREVDALLRFMYQGEVNVRQEELGTFLRVAEILQIKGLTGEETERKDGIKVEDEEASSRGIEDDDGDSKDWNDVGRCSRSLEEQSSKRKNREPTRKHGTSGWATKKSRSSLPAAKDADVPPASLEGIKNATRTRVYNEEDEIERKFYHPDVPGHLVNDDDSASGDFKVDKVNSTNDDPGIEENAPFVPEHTTHQNSTEDTFGTVVEPVTYRLSARGRPQLVHEGYVYNLTSRSEVLNRSHYRCAEQHRGCRGKCAVIAERFMPTGVHEHNHSPGYQSENDYKKKKVVESEQN